MNGKTFTSLCAVLLIVIAAGYFMAADRLAIADRMLERSFKPFLLRASGELQERLIIEGGSNATHGIDAVMIERHFGVFAINISDNGGYPLEHKIQNLRKYLKEGDTVILSLEWGQYTYGDRLPGNYVESVLDEYGSYSFYYRSLPLPGKIEFVFGHVPYQLAMHRILDLNGLPSRNRKLADSEAASMMNFYKFIEQNIRGSSYRNETEQKDEDKRETQSCDEYTLRGAITSGFAISDRFTKNLELLRAVQRETGARFIFVWPVVTGKYDNECYTSANVVNNINRYTDLLREQIEAHGFELLGGVMDSRFGSSCYLDTYYHIRHDCAVIRTRRLIHQLESAGIKINPLYSLRTVRNVLSDYLDKVNLARIDIPRTDTPVKEKDLGRYVLFRSGWKPGGNRFWSVGTRSRIALKRGDTRVAGIRLRGKYINARARTRVWVNGRFAGILDLKNTVLDVRDTAAEKGLLELTFEHIIPGQAEGSWGGGSGKRRKYRLVSVELTSEQAEPAISGEIEP